MRRLRAAEAAMLASLLGLWVACMALHVKQVALGQLAWVGVYVTAPPGADGFPVVRRFWPGAGPGTSGALAAGDRLVSVGGADLRGIGPIGFVARTYAAAAARRDLRVPLEYERDGAIGATEIDLVPVNFPWRMLPVSCTVMASAVLVLLRRPGKRVSRAFFLLAVAYGLHWSFFFGGSAPQTYAWVVVFFFATLTMLPLILRAALIFPTEVAPADGRLPWWPWLFAITGPIALSWVFGLPLSPEVGFRALYTINIVFIVTLLALLTRNFRRASPVARRQLKWVVLGMYVGTMPVLLTDLIAAVEPALWWVHEVAVSAETVVPICILIAIVRTNYFDVDRLITGAAVYTVLSVLLLAAVLAGVPWAVRYVSKAAEVDPRTVQLVLSVVVAASVVPAQASLSPRIERVLFRERHALRAGVEDLLCELAEATGPEELLTLVGERLYELVRPQTCVIYAPLGDSFVPVFASGIEATDRPPTLSADDTAIAALHARTAPLDIQQWARARGEQLTHDEQAALERLHAACLLPVRGGADRATAICLGAKRSGDVYTATDLALLAAVAHKVSAELQRFDAAVILRQARGMSDALRRYVPHSVAALLTRGEEIDGGERDVSVLFVDIRGYTTYSEARAAGTVFSMVNRYTEAVSAVIQRRGGTVVEFLGDGLMAVFGAPEPQPDHARISVEAAREVVARVRDLALGADDDQPVAVGVGIASGRAFVGNVRTSDRFVYTAVGDVVNLASRIQGLTRDLRAAVAIDARTHRTAGRSAAGFRRHRRVRIRGRLEPVDVYALPSAVA